MISLYSKNNGAFVINNEQFACGSFQCYFEDATEAFTLRSMTNNRVLYFRAAEVSIDGVGASSYDQVKTFITNNFFEDASGNGGDYATQQWVEEQGFVAYQNVFTNRFEFMPNPLDANVIPSAYTYTTSTLLSIQGQVDNADFSAYYKSDNIRAQRGGFRFFNNPQNMPVSETQMAGYDYWACMRFSSSGPYYMGNPLGFEMFALVADSGSGRRSSSDMLYWRKNFGQTYTFASREWVQSKAYPTIRNYKTSISGTYTLDENQLTDGPDHTLILMDGTTLNLPDPASYSGRILMLMVQGGVVLAQSGVYSFLLATTLNTLKQGYYTIQAIEDTLLGYLWAIVATSNPDL